MPIDASIYQNLKPIEMPSLLDSQQRAASLSQIALQNQRMARQAQTDERDQNLTAHHQRISVLGNAMEGLAGLSPQERAAAYPQARAQLVQSGVLKPEEAPETYDEGFFRQAYVNFKNSKEFLDKQLQKSQIARNYADAAKEKRDASGRLIPAGEASKIGNLLGAAEASKKIESMGGSLPTGKLEAAADWIKGLFDSQDQDRAKALADIANQRNEVMSRIAGANVTADEKARILEGIPTNKDAPESFTGKGRSTTDQLIGKAEAEIDALEAAGFDVRELRNRLMERKQEVMALRQSEDESKSRGKGGLVREAKASELTPQDAEAIHWAKRNRQDPRAQRILQMHGVK